MNTRRSGTSVANVGQRRPQPLQQPPALADNSVQGGQMKSPQQPINAMPASQQQQQPAAGPPKLQQPVAQQKVVAVATTPVRPVVVAAKVKPAMKEEQVTPVKQQQQAKPVVQQAKPAVQQVKPAVQQAKPAVQQAKPAVQQAKPIVQQAPQQPVRQQQTQDTLQMQKLTLQQQQAIKQQQLLKQQTLAANKAAAAAVAVVTPATISSPGPKPIVPPTAVAQTVHIPQQVLASVAAIVASIAATTPAAAPVAPVIKTQSMIEVPVETITPMEVGGDVKVEETMNPDGEGLKKKPKWLTNKVYRFSKADKIRRRNARFRKILQPKNALMILNEMNGSTQYTFVELGTQDSALKSIKHPGGFKAVTVVDGMEYNGVGVDKVTAKSNAAESAIKSIILKKILSASAFSKQQAAAAAAATMPSKPADGATSNSDDAVDNNGDTEMTEGDVLAAVVAGDAMLDTAEGDMVPWMHIASFALHKLFNSWEETGTLLRASSQGNLSDMSESANPFAANCAMNSAGQPTAVGLTPAQLPQRALPENALSMHPVMLLNQMRPGTTQYNEQAVIGTPPHILYSYECVVEGKGGFLGRGPNKKIARRNAAYAACQEVLNLEYSPEIETEIAESSEPRKLIQTPTRAPRAGITAKQGGGGVGGYFVRQTQMQQMPPQQQEQQQGTNMMPVNNQDGRDGYTTSMDPGYQWY